VLVSVDVGVGVGITTFKSISKLQSNVTVGVLVNVGVLVDVGVGVEHRPKLTLNVAVLFTALYKVHPVTGISSVV
jgi:hypothetical protein